MNILSILSGIVITGATYFIIPLILKGRLLEKGMSQGKTVLIAIGNAFLVSMIWYFLRYAIADGKAVVDLLPAGFWGIITYATVLRPAAQGIKKYDDYNKNIDFAYKPVKPMMAMSTEDALSLLECLQTKDGAEIEWKEKPSVIIGGRLVNVFGSDNTKDVHICTDADFNSEEIPFGLQKKEI